MVRALSARSAARLHGRVRARYLASQRPNLARRQLHLPSIVTVQPARIAIAALHPRIRARDRLNQGCARFTMRLVASEGALDVLALNLLQTARDDGRILDSGCRPLRHV